MALGCSFYPQITFLSAYGSLVLVNRFSIVIRTSLNATMCDPYQWGCITLQKSVIAETWLIGISKSGEWQSAEKSAERFGRSLPISEFGSLCFKRRKLTNSSFRNLKLIPWLCSSLYSTSRIGRIQINAKWSVAKIVSHVQILVERMLQT